MKKIYIALVAMLMSIGMSANAATYTSSTSLAWGGEGTSLSANAYTEFYTTLTELYGTDPGWGSGYLFPLYGQLYMRWTVVDAATLQEIDNINEWSFTLGCESSSTSGNWNVYRTDDNGSTYSTTATSTTGSVIQVYKGGSWETANLFYSKSISDFTCTATPPASVTMSEISNYMIAIFTSGEDIAVNWSIPTSISTEPTIANSFYFNLVAVSEFTKNFVPGSLSNVKYSKTNTIVLSVDDDGKFIYYDETFINEEDKILVYYNAGDESLCSALGVSNLVSANIGTSVGWYTRWAVLKKGEQNCYGWYVTLPPVDEDLAIGYGVGPTNDEGEYLYGKVEDYESIQSSTLVIAEASPYCAYTIPSELTEDDLLDYQLVCYISTEYHDVTYLSTDPTIEAVIYWNLRTEDQVKTTFTLSENIATQFSNTYYVDYTENQTQYSLDVLATGLSDASAYLTESTNYIRYAVYDAEGNLVSYEILTNDEGLSSSQVSSLVNETTVTGINSTGYSVVVALSSDAADVTEIDGETYYLNEPSLDVVLTFVFVNDDYFSDMLTPGEPKATNSLEYERQFVGSSETYTFSVKTESAYTYATDWGTATAYYLYDYLSGTSHSWNAPAKYVRWSVFDENDNLVTLSDIFANSSYTGSIGSTWGSHYASNYYSLQYNNQLYTVTSSDSWPMSSTTGVLDASVENITLSGVENVNYKVVCLISTDEPTTVTHNGQTYITEEPEFDLMVTWTFYTNEFVHYVGYENEQRGLGWDKVLVNGEWKDSGSPYDNDITTNGVVRQQTPEWTYYRYVKPGESANLMLRYTYSQPTLEPRGYHRWYDYNTDYAFNADDSYAGASLVPLNSGYLAHTFSESVGDETWSRGLFAYANSDSWIQPYLGKTVFTAPSTTWDEIVIAADVSRYVDGIDVSSDYSQKFNHEPTLSTRYKFVIRPYTAIADSLMTSLVENHVPFEDRGYLTLGIKSTSSAGTLRTDVQLSGDYWFYPCTAGVENFANDSYEFSSADFTTSSICQATKIRWYAYINDEYYATYKDVTSTWATSSDSPTSAGHMTTLSRGDLSNCWWVEIGGEYSWSSTQFDFSDLSTDSEVTLVAVAMDDSGNMCPVTRYIVHFLNEAPMPFDDLAEEDKIYRTVTYLENSYTLQAVIDFDNYASANFNAPTGPYSNVNRFGVDREYCYYGYAYPDLYEDQYQYYNSAKMLNALHSDHMLLKTMDLTGVSVDATTITDSDTGISYFQKYWWENNGAQAIYDRTYDYTNGADYGYFVYIDASDEARPIVSVPFEADICSGATLIVSAAVANLTSSEQKPQVLFEFFAIDTDDDGNEIARMSIQKFSSCDFATQELSSSIGEWVQVYCKTVLRSGTGIENYDHFLLQLTNDANGTQGADYAIDDIRIYTGKFKIDAEVTNVTCGEDDESLVTIKMPESTISDIIDTNATNQIILRFFYEDGTPYNGLSFEYNGVTYPFLVFDITSYRLSSSSDNIFELDSSCAAVWATDEEGNKTLVTAGYWYDDDGVLYYYFFSDYLDLPNQTIYVSMAPLGTTPAEALADVNCTELYWGNPGDICSVYSSPIDEVGQTMTLDGSLDSYGRITFDCDVDVAKVASGIYANVNVPNADGSVTTVQLQDVKLDWFVITYTRYDEELANRITQALQNFRRDYFYGNDNTIDTRTTLPDTYTYYYMDDDSNSLLFSEEDYNLIKQYLYGTEGVDVETTGVIYLGNDEFVPEFPVQVGSTYMICAIARYNPSQKIENEDGEITYVMICDDMMTSLLATRYDGPDIFMGFEDVNYPSDWDGSTGIIRIGINDLTNLQNFPNYQLHVPVKKYHNRGYEYGEEGSTDKAINAKDGIFLSYTNDPANVDNVGLQIASFADGEDYISSDHMYLALNFDKGVFTFHEGYEYELMFEFADEEDDDDDEGFGTQNDIDESKTTTETTTTTKEVTVYGTTTVNSLNSSNAMAWDGATFSDGTITYSSTWTAAGWWINDVDWSDVESITVEFESIDASMSISDFQLFAYYASYTTTVTTTTTTYYDSNGNIVKTETTTTEADDATKSYPFYSVGTSSSGMTITVELDGGYSMSVQQLYLMNGGNTGTVVIKSVVLNMSNGTTTALFGELSENYTLNLNEINSSSWDGSNGISNSYDSSTNTITFGSSWSGRGWWFSDALDWSDYDYLVFEVTTAYTSGATQAEWGYNLNATVQYEGSTDDNRLGTSESLWISYDAADGTTTHYIIVELNEGYKSGVQYVYLQSGYEGVDVTLLSVYATTTYPAAAAQSVTRHNVGRRQRRAAPIGDTVGQSDCSTAWWDRYSDVTELEPNKQVVYKFTNYTDGEDKTHNWALAVSKTHDAFSSDADKNYGIFTAYGEGWGSHYSGTGAQNDYDWDTFTQYMNGADVDVTIQHSAHNIYVTAVTYATNGKTYTYTNALSLGEEEVPVYVYFSPYKSYMTVDDITVSDFTQPVSGSDWYDTFVYDTLTGDENPRLGAEDNTSDWEAVFSEMYAIEPATSLTLKFYTYSSMTWDNTCHWNLYLYKEAPHVVTTTTEYDQLGNTQTVYTETTATNPLVTNYLVLRPDNWGWTDTTNGAKDYFDYDRLSNGYDWNYFDQNMNGAYVNLVVKRVSTRVYIYATITTVANQTFYYSYSFDCENSTDPIYTYLSPYLSHIHLESATIKNNTAGCASEVYVYMKVVPEYLTWNDGVAFNTNWNNDGNWTRSVRDEIYKPTPAYSYGYKHAVLESDRTTATTEADVNADYYNDDEIFEGYSRYTGQPNTYVPMHFSKVTIPASADVVSFPYLSELSVSSSVGTYSSLVNRDGSEATSNIQYEMILHADSVNVCSHVDSRYLNGRKLFEAQPFVGNTCKEIYFKPTAQLKFQHYLDYERAWAEQEFTAGEWQLVSAPLRDTYSGDAYTTTTGQQTTEAFTEITFENTSEASYSRTAYPIYQRAWDESEQYEVISEVDPYRAWYDSYFANYSEQGISVDGADGTIMRWNHTSNNLYSPYDTGLGYSLRAKRDTDEGAGTEVALLRWPKADASYGYYYHDDSTDGQVAWIGDREGYARFVTNARNGGDGTDGNLNGFLYVTPKQNSTSGDLYYLIGNPYMSPLYISNFLTYNTQFESSKFWTLENGVITAYDLSESPRSSVQPMQGFFVKMNSDSEPSQVVFRPAMTNYTTSSTTTSSSSSAPLRLSVPMQSVASVYWTGDADVDFLDSEDIELLIDNDVNATQLYTVAGSQMTSTNRLDAIDCVPVGLITSASDNVSVTVENPFGIDLYMLDAVKGTYETISGGEQTTHTTVTIAPNAHGRYFITRSVPGEESISVSTSIRAYCPSSGQLVVTSSVSDPLSDVCIYSVSGAEVAARYNIDGIATTFNLPKGAYVIKASTDSLSDVGMKVVVR